MVAADLGPWSGADLEQTARQAYGIGADEDVPADIRFVRNVARVVTRRLQVAGGQVKPGAGLSVFLLRPIPPKAATTPRVPMLGNGETEIAGRIWFVSPVANSGRYVEPPCCDDSSIFDFVVDDLGCGALPAVVFNPRLPHPEITFFPLGLGHEETCKVVSLREEAVTLDDILAVIERVHATSFVTPDAQVQEGSTVWERADQFWVRKHAEAVVQSHIKAALCGRFLTCDIRHEQTMTAGRVDLEIEQPSQVDPLAVVRPAVIEVKVLRSRGSTGRAARPDAILRWIARGVRQVAAYRANRRALNGILCCFDMRDGDTGDTCFDHVRSQASSVSVTLSRWFLYNSAEAWRLARFAPA